MRQCRWPRRLDAIALDRPAGWRADVARSVGRGREAVAVSVARAVALFVVAAVAEIGGAADLARRPLAPRGRLDRCGILALAACGFVATLQEDNNCGLNRSG
jgi:small multidrug resistance family-3 protein